MIKPIILMSALFSISMSWAARSPDVVGEAYSLETNQLLYQEQHYYSEDGQSHEVRYLSSNGEQFAHKALDYRHGKLTPTFRQENTRYSEVIEVTWVGKQLSISYMVESQGLEKKKMFDVEPPLVVDAGFDHFIRENWAVLTKGERLTFDFPAPSRLMLVNLAIKNQRCSYPTDQDQCFLVSSSSWLVSLLVEPIELGYDKANQKLKRFRGLANINDENGKGLKVDIRYTYPGICNGTYNSEMAECENKTLGLSGMLNNYVASATPYSMTGNDIVPNRRRGTRRYQW